MRRLSIFLSALLTIQFAALASAQVTRRVVAKKAEPVHTVRYSYEKWSRAKPARYVLIPRTTRLKPEMDQKDQIRRLFQDLRTAKSGSYGPKSAIAFADDFDKTKEVFVYLDKSKANQYLIVMAETVYTFTEHGALKVKFPGYKPAGWTRADVPIPAYTLAIPLWQVLPPNGITGALAQLPDGSLVSAGEALKRLKSGDQAVTDAMWKYTESGGAAALAAVEAASIIKPADLEDRLLPLLQSADKNLRRAAIEGLRGKDNKTVNLGLRAVVSDDPDSDLRDLAAGILAGSKDASFAATAQYHALKSSNADVVLDAAKALGSSKQKDADSKLVAVLQHEDSRVREAARESLISRGSSAVLVKQLTSGKLSKSIASETAKRLANEKSKATHHPALLFLVVNGAEDDAKAAAERLADSSDPKTIQALGQALKSTDVETRIAAAQSLAKIGKASALPLLAASDIQNEESGPVILEAISQIYAKQPLKTVLKATKDSDQTLKRSAVATLGVLVAQGGGKRNRKAILDALKPLSRAKDPLIRAAAARSFELMAGNDVRDDILRMNGDDAIEVRRAASHALRAFPGPKTKELLMKYLNDSDPVILANAADAVGILLIDDGRDAVIGLLPHSDVRVRRAATSSIVKLSAGVAKRALLRLLSERVFDSDGEVRLHAIGGLKLVKDEKTVTVLGSLIQDPVKEVRLATLDAMAIIGHAAAVDGISGALIDDDTSIRSAAIKALGKLNRKEAIPVLKAYMAKEREPTLVALAKKTIAGIK